MSWIGSLAGRAETFLNLVDQAAGQALQREAVEHRTLHMPWNFENETFEAGYNTQNSTGVNRQISFSASVPVNLNRLNEETVQTSYSILQTASSGRLSGASDRQTAVLGKKDKDEELFEFLNAPDVSLSTSGKISNLNKQVDTSGKSYREKSSSVIKVGLSEGSVVGDLMDESPSVSSISKVDAADLTSQEVESNDMSVEKENKILKQKITTLTQELNAVIKHNLDAQEELQTIRQQFTDKSRTVANAEELHARLADMQEALGTKDTQLAILKVRLEEVNQELESSRRSIDQLQAETFRLLNDKPSTTGSENRSCELLEHKLSELESQLKREQAHHLQTQEEMMEKLNALEVDKQRLCSEVGRIQRFYEEEKSRATELQSQLKVAKSLADSAKQDLSDYKEKAMRILQSKERLITSLKEGVGFSHGNGEQMVSSAEMETVRQERDMIRDELHHTRMALETAKLEITELEVQLQQQQDLLQKRIESLEEQIVIEKKRWQEVEEETLGHKQEIGKLKNELQKQTSVLLSRIDDRDEEIHRLRNQVTMKSLSGSSQDELENRLHSLTESLIQKQTLLEALSTEKNSLVLQLERMEKHYREAEAEAIRASAALAGVQDHPETRHRLPGLLKESPTDGEITRQVKHAANVVDRFSIRLGLFLRRYPAARVFVILYMALLHLWVFIVLMTYQQEIHKSLRPPQPPPNSQ